MNRCVPPPLKPSKSQRWQEKDWKAFREKNLQKQCFQCGSTESLCLHHLSQKYSYFDKQNVVTLCRKCHYILERFHKHLCPTCKKGYTRYHECYSCYMKKEQYEAYEPGEGDF